MSFPVRSGVTMPTALVSVGAGMFQAALCFPQAICSTLGGGDGMNCSRKSLLGAKIVIDDLFGAGEGS